MNTEVRLKIGVKICVFSGCIPSEIQECIDSIFKNRIVEMEIIHNLDTLKAKEQYKLFIQ